MRGRRVIWHDSAGGIFLKRRYTMRHSIGIWYLELTKKRISTLMGILFLEWRVMRIMKMVRYLTASCCPYYLALVDCSLVLNVFFHSL